MANLTTLRNIEIAGSNGRPILLDLAWKPNSRPKPLLIFAHGFKGFKDWGPFPLLDEAFGEREYIVARFNFSHNGTTPAHPTEFADLEAFGHNTFSKELDDLGYVIDYLCGKESPVPGTEKDPQAVYLLGHSRGGGDALLRAAEDNRVKKVAAWSPISDIAKRYPEETIQQWEKQGKLIIPNSRTGQEMPLYTDLLEDYRQHTARLDLPNKLPQVQQPVLVIHGSADQTVSTREALEIDERTPNCEFYLFHQAGHTLGGQHPWQEEKMPKDMGDAVEITHRFFQNAE